MKKQILILIALVSVFFGTEQSIDGAEYEETNISILNQISVSYVENQVVFELVGSFYGLTKNDIRSNFLESVGTIIIDQLYLDPSISEYEANNVLITLPHIKEVDIVEIVEQDTRVQLTLQYKNVKFLQDLLISPDKIVFYAEISNEITAPQSEFLISKLYVKPDRLNIAILHQKSTKKKAYRLSQKLLKKRKKIERDLENKLNIINITKIPLEGYGRNVIYFRQNQYLSAIYLADMLEDVYVMIPFVNPQKKKDTDLEILIIK